MLTVKDFCLRYRIGLTTFYRLRATGNAPRIVRIGKSVRITEAAATEWIASREAASNQRQPD